MGRNMKENTSPAMETAFNGYMQINFTPAEL